MKSSAPAAHGATRESRLRARRRRGVRHIVEIDIWDADLDAMIRRGELSSAEAQDRARVADAIEDLLERTLHTGGSTTTTATAATAEERRMRDDRREDADRRTEAERRGLVERRIQPARRERDDPSPG